MHDLNGRSYVKYSELKQGLVIETDGGFTCMPSQAKRVVYEDSGQFYVVCNENHHYIQEEENGTTMGFYHVQGKIEVNTFFKRKRKQSNVYNR